MSFTRKTPKKPKSSSFAEKPKSARIPTAETESQALVKNRRGLRVKQLFSFHSNEPDHTVDIIRANINFQKKAERLCKIESEKRIRCQGDVMHWKRRSKLTNSAKILMGYLPFCQLSVIGHIDLSDIPLLG